MITEIQASRRLVGASSAKCLTGSHISYRHFSMAAALAGTVGSLCPPCGTDGKPRKIPDPVGSQLLVVSILRHLADPRFTHVTGWTDVRYVYDIELADTGHRAKVLLSPAVYPLIEKAQLTVGSIIQISSVSSLRPGTPEQIAVITGVNVIGAADDADVTTAAALPFHPHCATQTDEGRPLLGERKFYLPLTADDAMDQVPQWKALSVPILRSTEGEKVNPDAPTIASVLRSHLNPDKGRRLTDGGEGGGEKRGRRGMGAPGGGAEKGLLASVWAGFAGTDPAVEEPAVEEVEGPRLIGRLACVGKLVHYGTSDKANQSPFKFTLRIVDATASVDVTFWGVAAAKFHPHARNIPLGAVIAVSGFRIKVYKNQLEASVDPGRPSNIKLLREEAVSTLPADRFPPINYRMFSPAPAVYFPSGAGFSLGGVVTWIGPVVRAAHVVPDDSVVTHPSPKSGVGPWFQYRWLCLRGVEEPTEFAVKLFANSRTARFGKLTVGDPVVLTFLRLVSVLPASSPPPRCCYAVSSEFTDIVIAPRINDLSAVDGVTDIVEFAAAIRSGKVALSPTGRCLMTRPLRVVEYCDLVGAFPVLDDTTPAITVPSGSRGAIQEIPFPDLEGIIDDICSLEMKRVLVRAVCVEVTVPEAEKPVEAEEGLPVKRARRGTTSEGERATGGGGEKEVAPPLLGSPLYKLRSRRVPKGGVEPATSGPSAAAAAGSKAVAPKLTESSERVDGVPSFRLSASAAKGAPSLTLPLCAITPFHRAIPFQRPSPLTGVTPAVGALLSPLLPLSFKGTSMRELCAWLGKRQLLFGVVLYREDGLHVRASVEAVFDPAEEV